MKRLALLLSVVALVAFMCTASFAQLSKYVLTDDDNGGASNSATLYTIGNTGTLTEVHSYATGGTGLGGAFFDEHGVAVAQNANCAFIVDAGSDDIAAFKRGGGGLTLVGRFSNAALSFSVNGAGGSVALTPNGKFLYGGYTGSENIGEWSVNTSTCALTFVGTYLPTGVADEYSQILPTPDGKYLIVPMIDEQEVELATINPTSGALTDASNVSFVGISSTCTNDGCYPTGTDITKDGKIVVFGDAAGAGPPAILTATISSGAFSNPKQWDMTNSCGIGNMENPWLSPKAYTSDAGYVYVSGGYGPNNIPSGVVTTKLSATGISAPTSCIANNAGLNNYDGLIETVVKDGNTGTGAVVAEFFNDLSTFKISSTGVFTHIADKTDSHANGGLSFTVYPPSR